MNSYEVKLRLATSGRMMDWVKIFGISIVNLKFAYKLELCYIFVSDYNP